MKKERTLKPLTLARESIRLLTENDLSAAEGGARSHGGGCPTNLTCYRTCTC